MRLAGVAVAIAAMVSAPQAWAQARPVIATNPAPPSSFLGIWVWQIDAARAKEMKLPEVAGVQVTRVAAGSPADLAGIKPGDVIAEYNGQKVAGEEQFVGLVRDTPAGRLVRLKIFRNGAPQTIGARIGAISATDRMLGPRDPAASQSGMAIPAPDVPRSLMTWRSPMIGIDAEPLFGQLASYFGVSGGVLVRSVAAGSPAEKAGLKAGDVITHVAKTPVAAPAEVTARLRMLNTSSVRLTVVRERNEISLTFTLE